MVSLFLVSSKMQHICMYQGFQAKDWRRGFDSRQGQQMFLFPTASGPDVRSYQGRQCDSWRRDAWLSTATLLFTFPYVHKQSIFAWYSMYTSPSYLNYSNDVHLTTNNIFCTFSPDFSEALKFKLGFRSRAIKRTGDGTTTVSRYYQPYQPLSHIANR
jgi:hypothetical protein